MTIIIDNLQGPEIAALLNEHLRDMHASSPAESVHALDLDGLRHSNITFWTLWEEGQLAGCGALKALNNDEAEIKSMRTAANFKRRGVAKRLLQHIIEQAKARQFQRINLETGSMAYFHAARELYKHFGFTECAPFGDYQEDPHSIFMTMRLD